MHETQLINACQKGDLRAVQFYKEKGSSITFSENALLDLAAMNGYFEIVEFLIKNGAKFQNLNFIKKYVQRNGYTEILEIIVQQEKENKFFNKLKRKIKNILDLKLTSD